MSARNTAGSGYEGHNGCSISKMTIAGNGIRVARRAWDAKVPVQLPDSPIFNASFYHGSCQHSLEATFSMVVRPSITI